MNGLPEENHGLFAATLRSLVAGDYLRATTSLSALDLPAEVDITDRARAVLDGWPGAAPTQLAENLAGGSGGGRSLRDRPVRKSRLMQMAETVKEVGVSTAGEVLAKVLMGGGA
jgi:hypothetical protein